MEKGDEEIGNQNKRARERGPEKKPSHKKVGRPDTPLTPKNELCLEVKAEEPVATKDAIVPHTVGTTKISVRDGVCPPASAVPGSDTQSGSRRLMICAIHSGGDR